MGKFRDWLKSNNIEIDMKINDNQPEYLPLSICWIHLVVVAKFTCVVTTTFKSLQGHHTTVAIQRTRFVSMQTSMLHLMGVYGPMSPS